MSHNVQDFLNYEISEMHKNIDRIKNHLGENSEPSTTYSGQYALLAIQNEHLALIEDLKQHIHSYDDIKSSCQRMILDNETLHRKIAMQENQLHRRHSAEWWHSLHLIQFWSDFLARCNKWQNR